MKYSIIYPYYKRPEQTMKTLESLAGLYAGRTDFEVIFILDLKNNEKDKEMFNACLEAFWHRMRLVVITTDVYSYNSSRPYNLAVQTKAAGEFIILSNPECMHKDNILKGLDEEFSKNLNAYVVCACESINLDGSFVQWYQHSVHSNRNLHFCTAISKANYLKSGGFNEDYCLGLSYEDNEWLKRVKRDGYRIVVRDDLLVSHIEHSRSYNRNDLCAKNRDLYVSLWERKK